MNKRLKPTEAVVKRLFAKTGNECSMPDCDERLVNKKGTLVGIVAHINGVGETSARYDPSLTAEELRKIENLIIVCSNCHLTVDDKNNEDEFPVEYMLQVKENHEARFEHAISDLVRKFADETDRAKPKYPKTLTSLAEHLEMPDLENAELAIEGIKGFVDKLRNLPLPTRQFAIAVARRKMKLGRENLSVEDVMDSLNIDHNTLNRHIRLLQEHQLGDLEQGFNDDEWFVWLSHRDEGECPWTEVLDYCDGQNIEPDDFFINLNFALYD